jgi:hypothetical protein
VQKNDRASATNFGTSTLGASICFSDPNAVRPRLMFKACQACFSIALQNRSCRAGRRLVGRPQCQKRRRLNSSDIGLSPIRYRVLPRPLNRLDATCPDGLRNVVRSGIEREMATSLATDEITPEA